MNINGVIPSSIEDSCPLLMAELPLLEFSNLFPTHQDLTQLTERISIIDVDLNTHDLRIELEKMKRR